MPAAFAHLSQSSSAPVEAMCAHGLSSLKTLCHLSSFRWRGEGLASGYDVAALSDKSPLYKGCGCGPDHKTQLNPHSIACSESVHPAHAPAVSTRTAVAAAQAVPGGRLPQRHHQGRQRQLLRPHGPLPHVCQREDQDRGHVSSR
jgi:hypothetical protein